MKPVQVIFQMLSDRHPKGAIANASTVQNVLFREIWERESSLQKVCQNVWKEIKTAVAWNCKDWTPSHFWTGENEPLIGSLATLDW